MKRKFREIELDCSSVLQLNLEEKAGALWNAFKKELNMNQRNLTCKFRAVVLPLALLLAASSCKTIDCGCPMTMPSKEQLEVPAEKTTGLQPFATAR